MSPTDPPVAYERRIVSVLFADLVGFTSLGERLDPEDVAAIQDRYFAAVRQTMDRYGGRLEKFIGDAAMAAFGIPRTLDDDAERAVRAGLAIVAAVERLAAELDVEPGSIAVRVGIATGEVVHAEAGPDTGRLTGDTVNLAARLQTAAPPGGVLLSEATALAVGDAVHLGPPQTLELKGKAEPVRAREALGTLALRSREAAMGGLRAPTLGRDGELDELLEALDRARRNGVTERWLVAAPPGTGKTRLLEELALRRDASVTLRRARFRSDDPRPYGAIPELAAGLAGPDLDGRLRDAGMAEGRAAVVADALNGLADGRGTDGPGAADRDSRFGAWLDGFSALANADGELWIVEDAHWAGRDALAFLGLAGAEPLRAGRLIVVSTRPSLLEREPDWSAPGPGLHRLDLAGLAAGSAESLIRALVGEAIPPDVVGRIARASDGNCLFIEELLRTWVSVGILVRDGSSWQMTSAGDSIAIPPTVHAVYGAQLDDLPPAARLAARRAAVAGRRFPLDALPELGIPDSTEALASLDRRSLISGPTEFPVVGPGYAYRHALLRDAAYASLARAERAALHASLARWLEAVAAGDVDEVAESIGGHYEAALASAPALATSVSLDLDRATVAARAASWLERAAAHARRQAADDAAAGLLRRALEHTPADRPLDRARRELELGNALRRAGSADDAVAAFDRSLTLAREVLAGTDDSSPARMEARSAVARAGAALATLDYERLRFLDCWQLAERLLAEIGPPDDVDFAQLSMARALGRAGETNETAAWIEDATSAVETFLAAGERDLELEARIGLVSARGEAGLAVADDWRAVGALATAIGNHEVAMRAAVNATSYLLDERPRDVAAELAPARELAEAWGLRERLAWIDYVQAEADLVTGDWGHGIETALRAFEVGEARSFHRVAVRTLSALLPMAALSGRDDVVARGHAWFALAGERSLPDSPYGRVLFAAAGAWFAAAGLVPAELPDPERLREGLQLEASGPSWLSCVAAILGEWRTAGRLDLCRAAMSDIVRAQRTAALASTLANGAIGVEAAAIEAADGNEKAAAALAREALMPLRAVGAAWWTARALRTLEHVGAATDEVREAEAIERRIGLARPAA